MFRGRLNVSGPIELKYWLRTVYLGPFIASVAIFSLFALVPQMREVYLGIIESKDVWRGLLGLAMVTFLCALIHAWEHMLATSAINRIYPEHGNVALDRRLQQRRDALSNIAAGIPLVGLGVGLAVLYRDATESARLSAAINLRGQLSASQPEALNDPPFYIAIGAIAAALILLLLISLLRGRIGGHELGRYSLRKSLTRLGAILSIAAILLPLMFPDFVVRTAQAAGPLAMTAVVLGVLVTLLKGISYLSIVRLPLVGMRLPISGIMLLLVLLWSAAQIYLSISPRSDPAAVQTTLPKNTGKSAEEADLLPRLFKDWLAARNTRDASNPYPVFIVAAQGGGIYAASAASAFLASIQDLCPQFAEHVFAISGVSGGAIGSALFSAALEANKPPRDATGCRDGGAEIKRLLTDATRAAILEDHLSPALAMIWPDIVRKFIPDWIPARRHFDRSNVLERSFACSFDGSTRNWSCPQAYATEGTGLRQPFQTHWTPQAKTPALVFTSTWVETGYRAAFAPFPLHAASDGTLFSFYSKDRKGDFGSQGAAIRDYDRSIIESAFVSARFPGIVSAWQARTTIDGANSRLWNFVDGGYVDNSGATTALELYRLLERDESVQERRVGLHLILLTDAETNPDLSAVADGTTFSDLVAPVTALLNVRGQLAGRAVTRAIDRLAPNRTPDLLAGRCGPTNILVVNLRQKMFQFMLGWKISTQTDNNVRMMLGAPGMCSNTLDTNDELYDASRVIRDNSCVKRRIEDLMRSKKIPQPKNIGDGACPIASVDPSNQHQ